MAERDLDSELFGPGGNDSLGRDLEDELFGAQPAARTVTEADKERTIGESIKDVGAGLVGGLGSIVQVPGQLYGLATGDFSKTGLLGAGERLSEYGEEMKSEGLKAREAERAKIVEEASKEGQFAAFKAALGETITDPGLLAGFLAEQAPQVIPMILAGGGAGYVAKRGVMSAAAARGAAVEAAERLAQKKALQAGTVGAIQTGAVMQGADVGAGAYDDIVAGLIEQGATPEQAAEEAINKARLAGVAGYGLSVLANRYLPGGKALEEILAGKRLTGSRLGGAALTGLKEIPSENIEEVGGRIAQNIAARSAGLDREILEGTGETAAMATLGAAGIGGAAGALSGRPAAAKAGPDEFDKELAQFRQELGPEGDAPAQVQEEIDTGIDAGVEEQVAAAPVAKPPVQLPGGFTATERELSREVVPEAFGIFPEGGGKPLATVGTQEDAQKKLESLTQIRQEEQKRLSEESDKINNGIFAEQRKLEVMEATGQAGTDQYVQAKAELDLKEQEAAEKLTNINDQIAAYSTPLTFAPMGQRTAVQSEVVVNRGDEVVGVFPTLEAAEASLREVEPETFKQADMQARRQQVEEILKPAFAKFNLGDVGLNIVEALKTDDGQSADGSYARNLIQISMDAKEPLKIMRHESMHALKELGFFTPQQWRALTEQANKTWVKQYLQGEMAEIEVDGVPQQVTRLEAYKRMGLSKQAIIEEAIADAFGSYARGATPPPGMIAALYKKLVSFFANFGQALRGAGFESSEDIFQRVERGELKSRKPKAKPAKAEKREDEDIKPGQTMGQRLSLLRKAYPDEIDISTQNPQGVKRTYDPITEMLSIDEKAVREAMKANPEMGRRTIQAIKSYGFVPDNTPNSKVLEVFKDNIVNNLLFLYDKVPASTRNRSKLWYDGANKIAKEMASNNDMSLRQVSAIMAAMSPQKDWFQNVSMAERAIDILRNQGDRAWTPDMLKYAESYVKESKDRKEREKRQDAFEEIKKVADAGTVLNDMDEKSAAAFVRAYDEAFHSRDCRIVTPEGGFGELVTKANGQPATMMWSTYGPIEKTVSIFRDGSRENVSEQLGFEHKIRSFYNNIANPNSEIDHVTIDTHAVAAGLFEALAGTDTEVMQNFGGTGKSDVLGVGGTYGLIAEAYREAAKARGVRAREMQSITWEAVRALFNENIKSTIKPKIRAEWKKYKTGQQSFDETRANVMKIAGQPTKIDPPDWINSGAGQFVVDGGASYDKSFKPAGGVRLREEREIRERVTFNLSAVTNSIPGLRDLYSRAMKGDDDAYQLLQKVAESSLQHLLKGTGARVKIEYAKGVYLSDREPSISVSAAFEERNQQVVMGALAKFADNYNQQQIHVRAPTTREIGHEFGDGSYATPVYEIALKKNLNNVQISDIIDRTGLEGFSIVEREVAAKGKTTTESFLTAYWVAPNDTDQEFESFDKFQQAITSIKELVGREGEKARRTVERLYVYGEGYGARIKYKDIQGDLLPSEGADSVTPRLIAEYLQGKPVKVFKQKDLTNKQVESQELLAKVFDELPTKDLKNPMVRKAYEALNKELIRQYNAMPTKVKLVEGKLDEDGNFIDIYKNSTEMRKDVSDNNRFKVFKTEPGTFGPLGFGFKDHPLLKSSGVKDVDGKPMLFNDVLRAVHDYYAHNLSDVQFGPKGEAAAWRNHMSVTRDPMARWALTAETRAQNAWQNFREGVKDTPLKDRLYADQKAALPPIGFTFTGESDVDQIMADYVGTLTPEQRLGSLPADSQYAAAVQKQIPKYSLTTVRFPSVKAVKEAVKGTSVPTSPEFKRFIAGNQWNDADGKPTVFYHATAREFLEFTPAGQSQAIFLATTPEEAETFGSAAEDKLRREIYEKLLNKDQKLSFFQGVVDAQVKKGTITEKQGKEFMRQVDRKAPKYGDFGDIEQEVYDALLDLSPTRMSIMPLYARAETPFDFENEEHVEQVMQWVANNTDYPQAFPDQWLRGLKGRIKQGLWQAIEDKRVQMALDAFKFDSFTLRENRNSPKNYAVYKPEQVKSVTGNLGEYGREEKNIRYSLPSIPSDAQNRIEEATTVRQQKGFTSRIIEAISPKSVGHFRAEALNRYNQLSVYDKKLAEKMGGAALLADQSAESAALMSDLASGVVASAMGTGNRTGGIPVLRNGITTIDSSVKGLVASLAPLAVYGDPVIYRRYQYWAMVKRGVRLNAQGKDVGITVADVAFAKMLRQKHPEFVSVQEDLIKFNNGLVKYMVDTGVLSKGRAAEYTKYADYVPFYRQMDGETTVGPNLFQSLSGVRPPKKLKGGDAPLADFLETMVRNTAAAIQAGAKNYAGQRAINVVQQVKAPGMGATRLDKVSNAPDVINVLENGELVSYQTPDELLLYAVKSLNLSDIPYLSFVSAPADLLRNLVTKDPGFMMANLLRDSLSAYVTSGQKMTPVVDTVISFGKALADKSPATRALLDAGIISGYDAGDIESSGMRLEEDLAKKAGKRRDSIFLRPFKSVWDGLEAGTTASDAATRAVIYDRVLAETGNEAEALFRALEVMNFHRKGGSSLVRVLTAAVPFFNARLQGLDLFYRASTGNMNTSDAAAIRNKFWARGMTMMGLSVAYWFMVSDDEEYKKQEQETRDNSWLIPSLGMKIPIPFEVGVLFKTIPERIAAYTFGDDTGKDLRDSLARSAVSTFAFNPIPQTVKPVIEAAFDFNTFTWRPILSEGMKDVDPQFQVGPGTSSVAKGIAGALGLSPIKVDHVIKGYTGTMGMYAIDTIDMMTNQFSDTPKATKRFEQLPVIKRFALDPEARGNVTEYYKLKDSVDGVVRTMNFLEKQQESEEFVDYLKKNQGTLAFKDYIRDTEKTMKELRDARNAIRISAMSGDEKREALVEIGRAESAITGQIQRIKQVISSVQ